MALDCGALLRDYLTVPGTALHDLCGERVYVARCPTGFLNGAPAVRIKLSGGGNRTVKGNLYKPRFYVLCYGGTNTDHSFTSARQVWSALSDRLHGATRAAFARGVLLSAANEDPGDELIDQETEWAAVGTFYSATMKER